MSTTVSDQSPDARVAESWTRPAGQGSESEGIERHFEREREERRRSLEDLRWLDDDLRRERAQDRFYRIRRG